MYKTSPITDKKIWESFLQQKEITTYPFFQSWNWGKVQETVGFPVSRFGIWQGKKLLGICQIVEVKAKRGHYFHLRHGPVLLNNNPEVFTYVIEEIKRMATEKAASFIRMSPLVKKDMVEKDLIYQKRVYNQYQQMAKKFGHWVVVECVDKKEEILPKSEVHQRVLEALKRRKII